MNLTTGMMIVIRHDGGPVLDPIPKRGEIAKIPLSKTDWVIIEVWGSGKKITWGKIREVSNVKKKSDKEKTGVRKRRKVRRISSDN